MRGGHTTLRLGRAEIVQGVTLVVLELLTVLRRSPSRCCDLSLAQVGPPLECRPADPNSGSLSPATTNDDEEVDWDILGAVAAISLTLIIISLLVICAVSAAEKWLPSKVLW